VRLGREIQDGVGAVLGEHARHRLAIGDVAAHEGHPRVLQRRVEVQQAAGVGQLVDDNETIGGVRERVVNEIRADESGSAGNQERHAIDNLQLTIYKANVRTPNLAL
jgi:hypothetical protein